MTHYRKKPIVIEAVQFNGLEWVDDAQEPMFDLSFSPPDWMLAALSAPEGHPGSVWTEWMPDAACTGVLVIGTLEGQMEASPGDWIIQGVKGEIYPCKPNIFAEIYESASSEQGSAYRGDA